MPEEALTSGTFTMLSNWAIFPSSDAFMSMSLVSTLTSPDPETANAVRSPWASSSRYWLKFTFFISVTCALAARLIVAPAIRLLPRRAVKSPTREASSSAI